MSALQKRTAVRSPQKSQGTLSELLILLWNGNPLLKNLEFIRESWKLYWPVGNADQMENVTAPFLTFFIFEGTLSDLSANLWSEEDKKKSKRCVGL